jgi:FkbM family methyltransferase
MALTAPIFLMKYPYLRKRTRDLWGFWYLITHGSRFVGRRLGLRLLFDLDNTIDRYLLAFGSFDEAQQKILFAAARAAARPGERAVFLDVGAHWGVYALLAQASGLFDRVAAIEPDPRNLDQLHANLFLNDYSGRIDVVEAAASSTPGELTFSLGDGRSRNLSKVSSVAGTDAAMIQRTVPAVRIDDVEPTRGGLVVAKIDVEEYEHEVIKGMEALLTGNRGVIQVEVWPDATPQFDAQMAALGYQLFDEVGSDRFYRNHDVPAGPA